jgi:hypothetical protein
MLLKDSLRIAINRSFFHRNITTVKFFSRIKWLGFPLLLLMLVRVSITPGIKHQHEHGELTHSHHAEGSRGEANHHHPHSHTHAHHSHDVGKHETKIPDAELTPSRSHVHISVFGWELTLSSPLGDADFNGSENDSAVPTTEHAPKRAGAFPVGLSFQSVSSWGELVQMLWDIRSPWPPAKLELPQGNLSTAPHLGEHGFSSRDRDKPVLPPPERGSWLGVTC